MKRSPALLALLAVATSFVAPACTTREPNVLVEEPKAKESLDEPTPLAKDTTTDEGPSREDDGSWGIREPNDARAYAEVVRKVTSMVSDRDLQSRVARRNLSLVNVAWEDTGRALGSSLGPNISDLSLQVRQRDENGRPGGAVMPVIRAPNFTDRTGDVPADRFFVRVGNHEKGGALRTVALTDVLRDVRAFASRADSVLGSGNLLAARDTHFLVSAQAVFLPIPRTGKAEFNPVLFNYQSAPGSPAVLSILVTRQGTSIQVIENRGEERTAAGWGQELYFNDHAQRAAFTAERKSDVEARIRAHGGPTNEDEKSSLQKGADVLFLVQVPLVHENRGRLGGSLPEGFSGIGAGGGGFGVMKSAPAPAAEAAPARRRSDVEQAVLGHGPALGPWNDARGLRLVRDPKFPIRVTVQFYKATSNGVVSDVDLDSISRSIGSVYEHAEFVGSLVLPEDDAKRPTAWQKVPHAWFPW